MANQHAPRTADASSDNVLFVAVAAGLLTVAGGAGHVDKKFAGDRKEGQNSDQRLSGGAKGADR